MYCVAIMYTKCRVIQKKCAKVEYLHNGDLQTVGSSRNSLTVFDFDYYVLIPLGLQ